jgi:hypothetical protein
MGNKLIIVHSPECDAGATGNKRDFNCCVGNYLINGHVPNRVVSLRIFPFDSLTRGARKVAIDRERKTQIPVVVAMAGAYLNQTNSSLEFRRFAIDEVTHQLSVHVIGAPPDFCERVEDTLRAEIPLALSDEKMIEHIKADNLEFLADGTLWVYADKEAL